MKDKIGNIVYWNDPENLTSDYYIIKDIDEKKGVYLLSNWKREAQANKKEITEKRN